MQPATHKILVKFQTEPAQIVTDMNYKVLISLTNIGSSTFPGGEVTYLGVAYGGMGAATQSLTTSARPKIPPINVNETFNLSQIQFYSLEDGTASISMEIKPNDDSKLSLYQNLDYDMGNRWLSVFKIKNADTLRMLQLLEDIKTLLQKGQKNE